MKEKKNINSLKDKIENGKLNSVIDYTFHFKLNYLDDFLLNKEQIERNYRKIMYQYGINTFNLDTYSNKYKLLKGQMLEEFKIIKKYVGLALVNCNDEKIILNIKSKYDNSNEEKSNFKYFLEDYSP